MTLKQRLEMLDILIYYHVQSALGSLGLKWYMDQFFYAKSDEEKKQLFKTNIANTYLYGANLAYFEKNFLYAGDQIHEELCRLPKLDIEILHRWDLKNHRDYLSHPGKAGQFENPEMKKFIEEKRYYKEPKAILLWNSRQSILDSLENEGSDRKQKHPTTVFVHSGMVELVTGAINYCLNDEVPRPTIPEVSDVLGRFFIEFEKFQAVEAARQYCSKEKSGKV